MSSIHPNIHASLFIGLALAALLVLPARAQVKVVTTCSSYEPIAEYIGGDHVEVVTSTGREAHRVMFFRQDGELRIAITPLSPDSVARGTTVGLASRSFDKESAREVIRKFLGFNTNARINVSVDGHARSP